MVWVDGLYRWRAIGSAIARGIQKKAKRKTSKPPRTEAPLPERLESWRAIHSKTPRPPGIWLAMPTVLASMNMDVDCRKETDA